MMKVVRKMGTTDLEFKKGSRAAAVLDTMIPIELDTETTASTPEEIFLIIRETLTRMGIPSYSHDNKNALFQSCHILYKRGKYYICHFKQLLALDGRAVTMTLEDLSRLLRVAWFLKQWNMINYVDGDEDYNIGAQLNVKIKILRHDELNDWLLIPKHNIGLKQKQ